MFGGASRAAVGKSRSSRQGEKLGQCNIVIFELGDAEIMNCAPYRVDSIRVESEEIGNHWFV